MINGPVTSNSFCDCGPIIIKSGQSLNLKCYDCKTGAQVDRGLGLDFVPEKERESPLAKKLQNASYDVAKALPEHSGEYKCQSKGPPGAQGSSNRQVAVCGKNDF